MASQLSDLEEWIFKCHYEKVSNDIKQTVAYYKTGAFIYAIVTTWPTATLGIGIYIRYLMIGNIINI